MPYNLRSTSLAFLALLIMSGSTWAQAKQQTETLVINGQTGEAAVVRVDGRTYVNLKHWRTSRMAPDLQAIGSP